MKPAKRKPKLSQPIPKKVKKRAAVSESFLKKLRFKAMLLRDGPRCLKCGQTQGLSPSHIYPQGRYRNMAWELDNVKPLCWGCHLHFWHKNPVMASEWIKTVLPKARLNKLKKMSQQILPKPDLVKIKEIYLKEISKYERP